MLHFHTAVRPVYSSEQFPYWMFDFLVQIYKILGLFVLRMNFLRVFVALELLAVVQVQENVGKKGSCHPYVSELEFIDVCSYGLGVTGGRQS